MPEQIARKLKTDTWDDSWAKYAHCLQIIAGRISSIPKTIKKKE